MAAPSTTTCRSWHGMRRHPADRRPAQSHKRQGPHEDEYVGIVEADAPIVAAVPGGGWRVEYKLDGGEIWSDPVLAWLIRSDGSVFAVDSDVAGIVSDVTETRNFHQLVAPQPTERTAP